MVGALLLGGVWSHESFREPARLRLPAQRMLVLEREGDPALVGPATFRELDALCARLSGAPRGATPPARVRWESIEGPKTQWRGRYAVPVPDTVTQVPAPARLETWAYGEVAQLAYAGAYTTDEQTIETLHAFIDDQGDEIAGEHEEEYPRGPDPSLTLIRYEVRPKASGQSTRARPAPWEQLAASWATQLKLMFRP